MQATTLNTRGYNFGGGPAALPLTVLQEVQEHLLCLPGAGMSALEMGHRTEQFEAIMQEAEDDLRSLLGIPETYHVLFLQGGGALQFAMVPMNLMRGRPADYVEAGLWSKMAMLEAGKFGETRVAWRGTDPALPPPAIPPGAPSMLSLMSRPTDFTRMPAASEITINPDAAYLHLTTNETNQGVELHADLDLAGVPVVADASSDILSRPMDVTRYALIYASAQKNLGPAGVTLVIVRDDLIEESPPHLAAMLDYRVQADHRSRLNTPPVFSIYVLGRVVRWLRTEVGGLQPMRLRNQEKARLLYDAIDRSEGFYRGHAQPQSRSIMNVCFRLPSKDLDRQFLAEAVSREMYRMEQHQLFGGVRASIYNGFPIEGVYRLVELMDDFRRRHAHLAS